MTALGGSVGLQFETALPACPQIFLVGAPRSGTTLVYKALALHPEVTYISNWLRRRPRWPWLSALNRLPRAAAGLQVRYWFGEESNAYRYDKRRSLAERVFPAPVEGGPVFEACGVGTDDARATPEQAERLRRAFAGLVRFGGGATVVSKRIANNRLIPVLAEVFLESKFVNIVRDGRAVAHSLSKVDWWNEATIWWLCESPEEWRAAGKDDWELCARVWVEEVRAVAAGLERIDPSRVLDVAYEMLVAKPHDTLAMIARFGGLHASRRWDEALGKVTFANQKQTWRTRIDPDVIRRIEGFQGEELRRYGYL
jgi:hypothetical protein